MTDDNAGRTRILIIDDDESVRRVHRRVVERAGYEVRDVESVQDGLETADAWTPDLILLDLVMPDTRGVEALKILRETPATQGAIIIAVSGVIVDSDADRFKALGFDAIIPKPVDSARLLARIAEASGDGRGSRSGRDDRD